MTRDQITQKVQARMQILWDNDKTTLENAKRIQKIAKDEYDSILAAYSARKVRFEEFQDDVTILVTIQNACRAMKREAKAKKTA